MWHVSCPQCLERLKELNGRRPGVLFAADDGEPLGNPARPQVHYYVYAGDGRYALCGARRRVEEAVEA